MKKQQKNAPAIRSSAFSGRSLAIFAMIFVVIGGYLIFKSFAATPTSANLWVDLNGGSCTRSASASAYADSKACGSIDAAYGAAQPGDLVLVKCGNYTDGQGSNQIVFSSNKSAGPNVTIQSEQPQCATTGAWELDSGDGAKGGDYLTIKDFTINDGYGGVIGSGRTNVTIDGNLIEALNDNFRHQFINFTNSSYIAVTNNTIGPGCCGSSTVGDSPEGIRFGSTSSSSYNDHITISHNLIHYIGRLSSEWPSSLYGPAQGSDCGSACHVDGIHIFGMTNSTISYNRLYGAPCQGIFIESTNSAPNGNINIVGNAISALGDGGCGDKSIYIKATTGTSNEWSGTFNIAFNSAEGSLNLGGGFSDCASLGCTFNLTGNYMNLFVTNSSGNDAGCNGGNPTNVHINYSYNVWGSGSATSSSGCGGNSKTGALDFVKDDPPPATGIDMHLTGASTPAADYVPSGVCTAITTADIDGVSRPQGSACDAGAFEYTSSGGGSGVNAVYVSGSGNDSTCARGNSSKPCLSFQKAYSLAQNNDLIQVAAGSYAGQLITQTGTSNTVDFQCVSAHACTINGDLTLGQNNGSPSGNAPSNLTFDGIDVHGTVFGWYADNSGQSTGTTGFVFQNAHVWDTTAGGRGIYLYSFNGAIIKNVEVGPLCCNSDGIDMAIPRAGAPSPTNITLDTVNVHDIYDSCALLNAKLSGTSCSGSGFESGCSSCEHPDGSQWYGGLNSTIKNSTFTNINPGGGAAQGIFLQSANGGLFSNLTITGNTLGTTANNDLSISGPSPGTVSGTVNISNNHVGSNIRLYGDTASSAPFSPGVRITVANNTAAVYQTSLNNGCDLILSNGSTYTPTYSSNTFSNGQCQGGGGTTPKTGDVNGDGSVNVFDLSILLTNYGKAGTFSQGDLNSDGQINIFDLSILLSNYGS